MDLSEALEELVIVEQTPQDRRDMQAIQKYQELLGISTEDARQRFENHCQNLSTLRNMNAIQWASKLDRSTYLVRREDPIEDEEIVRNVLETNEQLRIHRSEGEYANTTFYELSGKAKEVLRGWLAECHPLFRPTIIHLNKANKELSDMTLAPFLGRDVTLPQHRPDTWDFLPQLSQKGWPVWYFFYGKLAEPEQLQRLLNLVNRPEYCPARVFGAKLRSWQGKYRAVVDGDSDEWVDGSAFLVESQDHEDKLRVFETNAYEVVRCDIQMRNKVQAGLVFRYCGDDSALL